MNLIIQYTNKRISNEQNKALVSHGNSTLREFGGKIKTNRELFFLQFSPLYGLSGNERQINHKLNRLRNTVISKVAGG